MNDDGLQQLLRRADEQLRLAAPPAVERVCATTLVESIRHKRARQVRRRGLGVLAVLLIAAGVSMWSLNDGFWRGGARLSESVAENAADTAKHDVRTSAGPAQGRGLPADQPAQGRRLRDAEIAQLKAEIAALDAEANRARRFVELYQAAEARRERLAATEAAVAEPLLPPLALADLEIDRAAGITVISADAQAKEFNRVDDAADAYRSVLKHFPDSRWASVARERLIQSQIMN